MSLGILSRGKTKGASPLSKLHCQLDGSGCALLSPSPRNPKSSSVPEHEYFFHSVLISDCSQHLIVLSQLVQPPHEYSVHMEEFSISLPINKEDNHSFSYQEVRKGLSLSPQCKESWETKGG